VLDALQFHRYVPSANVTLNVLLSNRPLALTVWLSANTPEKFAKSVRFAKLGKISVALQLKFTRDASMNAPFAGGPSNTIGGVLSVKIVLFSVLNGAPIVLFAVAFTMWDPSPYSDVSQLNEHVPLPPKVQFCTLAPSMNMLIVSVFGSFDDTLIISVAVTMLPFTGVGEINKSSGFTQSIIWLTIT